MKNEHYYEAIASAKWINSTEIWKAKTSGWTMFDKINGYAWHMNEGAHASSTATYQRGKSES